MRGPSRKEAAGGIGLIALPSAAAYALARRPRLHNWGATDKETKGILEPLAHDELGVLTRDLAQGAALVVHLAALVHGLGKIAMQGGDEADMFVRDDIRHAMEPARDEPRFPSRRGRR